MSDSPPNQPPQRKVIGFRRTKIRGTNLEGPGEPIYESEELEKPGTGRKLVGWQPTTIPGTHLVGPSLPIYEDEEPDARPSATES